MTFTDEYDILIEKLTKEWYAMNTLIPQPKWETPKYSRKQIERAGKMLSNKAISDAERQEALTVLDNWRSSHAYPLQVIANNLRRNNLNAIVVQRLKRLHSIENKLQRISNMNLYRMQDLGGCRVIVDSIDDVYNTIDKYKNSNIRHIFKREYDYIQNPKTSGYRCYHMVYQFHSDKTEDYNKNMLIEIQVRTKLQHIWATAVEMMGIYKGTSFKSGIGDEDILRFFTLVSSIFALTENMPVCPNTSSNKDELISEIKEIDKKHMIINTISAFSQATEMTNTSELKIKNGYYILRLDFNKMRLHVTGYMKNQFQKAAYVYNSLEQKHEPNTDTVLISADSFDTIRTAYPNYFADIGKFVDMMIEILQ